MRDRQMAAPDVAMLIRATSLDCFVARAPRSDEGGVWMSARGAVIASASEAIQILSPAVTGLLRRLRSSQ
jgi:hypothetical protein